MEKYSNCCGAEIINEDIEVCPQCKEPCEFIDGEEEEIEHEQNERWANVVEEQTLIELEKKDASTN